LRRSGLALAALALPRALRAQTCAPTTADAYGQGPFYLPDSPVRTSALAVPAEPGDRLSISGIVRDCAGPLPGARVEVWHADATGCYSGFPENQICAETPGEVSAARLRGTFVADAQGRYGYTTIMPAPYADSGGAYRTAHIHYRVTLPPASGSTVELITQLYFQGMPYLDTDDGSEDAFTTSGYQRIIALSPRAGGGSQGVFDIVLPGTASGLGRAAPQGFDVMVVRRGREVRFVLPPGRLPGSVFLRVATPAGRELHLSRHQGREVRWDASGLPGGTYAVELSSTHSPSREFFRLVL
jgi:protocatechuate 3,4-dioxygenase beta subunit